MYSRVAELACKDAVADAGREPHGGGTRPVVPVVALTVDAESKPCASAASCRNGRRVRASGTSRRQRPERLQQPSPVEQAVGPPLHENPGSPNSPERMVGLESTFQSDEVGRALLCPISYT